MAVRKRKTGGGGGEPAPVQRESGSRFENGRSFERHVLMTYLQVQLDFVSFIFFRLMIFPLIFYKCTRCQALFAFEKKKYYHFF